MARTLVCHNLHILRINTAHLYALIDYSQSITDACLTAASTSIFLVLAAGWPVVLYLAGLIIFSPNYALPLVSL
jgi:hypothetical protein